MNYFSGTFASIASVVSRSQRDGGAFVEKRKTKKFRFHVAYESEHEWPTSGQAIRLELSISEAYVGF